MLHLLAGASSVAQDASLANIGRLTDVLYTNTTDGYYWTQDARVVAGYVKGDSLTIAQLNSPNLRLLGPPKLGQLDTAADPPNLPPINEFMDNGPVLRALDPFNIQVSRGGVGAATCYYGLWLGSGYPARARGECRSLKATAGVTLSTSQWNSGTLSFSDNPLPAGKYRILGAMGYGANLLFGRFVFPDSNYRPGFLAQQLVSEYSWDWFRYGNMGAWGEFYNTAPPSMEFLGYGAGSSQTIIVDLEKIG